MVNPPYSISDDDDNDYPPKISPTPRVFNLNLCPDPKVFLDEAWILLEPALTSILHEENLDRFCFGEISQAVDKTSCNTSSSEDLSNLIVDVCGTYISTTLHSLAVHCNDDDSSLLLLPLEKFWLEFPKKLRFICEIAGAGGPNLWNWVLIFYQESSSWPLKFVTRFEPSFYFALQIKGNVPAVYFHDF
ncbi:Cullin repeat-like-containing domain protein [Raphanus sativus]|nr:Cullin repeat-like-containing domain protein [Raphanus sativus]